MRTVEIIISGKVQGVFYRHSAREKAMELGLRGIVENLANGNVRIIACGEEEALDRFYQWCRVGPPKARVEKIVQVTIPVREFENFSIRR